MCTVLAYKSHWEEQKEKKERKKRLAIVIMSTYSVLDFRILSISPNQSSAVEFLNDFFFFHSTIKKIQAKRLSAFFWSIIMILLFLKYYWLFVSLWLIQCIVIWNNLLLFRFYNVCFFCLFYVRFIFIIIVINSIDLCSSALMQWWIGATNQALCDPPWTANRTRIDRLSY